MRALEVVSSPVDYGFPIHYICGIGHECNNSMLLNFA